MHIDEALIDRLATLSKLSFEGEEKEAIRADLERMLDMIERLQAVDTDGVAPLIHMTEGQNLLRQDEVMDMPSQKDALKNAPSADGYYFRVPKVISGE